jgi:hypothetical protein
MGQIKIHLCQAGTDDKEAELELSVSHRLKKTTTACRNVLSEEISGL